MDKFFVHSLKNKPLLTSSLLIWVLVISLVFFGLIGVGISAKKASADETNTTPKSEVVYARLVDSGEEKTILVVNTLKPEKPGKVTDYGSYAEVKNLTDLEPLDRTSDAITVEVADESFSYQGEMVSGNLPWDIAITYHLDGKEMKGSELAGKSGKLEILITTKQNKAVDEVFFNNYLLQISCAFAPDKANNVETSDGQIALAGSDTQVTFTGMPEKESTFKIQAEIADFEMEGITFAAVPFSMIIDSPDAEEFISGFKKLNEGVGELNSGASLLADGAQELSGGVNSIAEGAGGVAEGANNASQGAIVLAKNSALIQIGMGELSNNGVLLATGSDEVQQGLEALATASTALNGILQDPIIIDHIENNYPPGTLEALQGLAQGVPQAAEGHKAFNTNLHDYLAGVTEVSRGYDEFNEGLSEYAQGLESLSAGAGVLADGVGALSGGASELASGADQLSDGTAELYTETQAMPDTVRDEIDKMMAEYDKSDFKPKSFTSSKNTNVELVQFVISTDPIEIEEIETVEEVVTEENFISRLLKLFGL